MNLRDKVELDLKRALKLGDATVVSTLRFLLSAVKYREIDLVSKSDLDEAGVIDVIAKQVKSHRESIEAFKKGNRPELVEKEETELKILQSYLPDQLDESQVRDVVQTLINEVRESGQPLEFGSVMKKAMGKLKGQVEGNVVKKVVEEVLKEG